LLSNGKQRAQYQALHRTRENVGRFSDTHEPGNPLLRAFPSIPTISEPKGRSQLHPIEFCKLFPGSRAGGPVCSEVCYESNNDFVIGVYFVTFLPKTCFGKRTMRTRPNLLLLLLDAPVVANAIAQTVLLVPLQLSIATKSWTEFKLERALCPVVQ
jgi:hypothetical protein